MIAQKKYTDVLRCPGGELCICRAYHQGTSRSTYYSNKNSSIYA